MGAKYGSKLQLFNSTLKGAYLNNWNHLPLNSVHPVVSHKDELHTIAGKNFTNKTQSTWGKGDLLSALGHEIFEETRIEAITTSLVDELLSLLLGDGGEDLTRLDSLEKDLSGAMNTKGSLITLYTLPAKLETDASLASATSLEDNLMASLDYYSAIKEAARKAITLLKDATTRIEQNMSIAGSQR